MTDTMSSSAADAGRLISYGIQAAKFRPTRDTDYRDLVLRFLADRDFERLVVAIAGGQGLSIVACDRVEGLIFAPTPESIYGIRLADYIGVESAEIRLLHGIVQLGIAVTAYPTANASGGRHSHQLGLSDSGLRPLDAPGRRVPAARRS